MQWSRIHRGFRDDQSLPRPLCGMHRLLAMGSTGNFMPLVNLVSASVLLSRISCASTSTSSYITNFSQFLRVVCTALILVLAVLLFLIFHVYIIITCILHYVVISSFCLFFILHGRRCVVIYSQSRCHMYSTDASPRCIVVCSLRPVSVSYVRCLSCC